MKGRQPESIGFGDQKRSDAEMKGLSRVCMSVAVTASAAIVVSCAAGKVGSSTPYEWPAGTAVTYEMVSGQVQTSEVPGGENQESESSYTLVLNVEAIGPRQFTITVTEASSTSPIADVKALIGLKSTVNLDSRGLIAEATGLEGNSYIEGRGGVDRFKYDLQNLFMFLPEGSFKPALEWKTEYGYQARQSGIDTKRTFVDTYRCIGETTLEGTPATEIKLKSEVELTGSGEMSGLPVDVMLAGLLSYTIHFDHNAGMLISLEGEGNIDGGFVAQGIDIPIETFVTYSVRVKK